MERLYKREQAALDAARFPCGSQMLPRCDLRSQIRHWFWERKAVLWRELARLGPER